MYDLMLFDLDGTLLDTAAELHEAVNDVLDAVGLPRVNESQVRSWIGNGSRELMSAACAHAGGLAPQRVRESHSMEAVMVLYDRFYEKRCGRRSRAFPGAADTLGALAGQGVELALISNRDQRYAETLLRAHGLRHFFSTVIGGDSLPARKPDPLPVLHCLRHYGVNPHRALFIGDSAIDVAAAHDAGVACWLVSHGYNGSASAYDTAADRVIDGLPELMETLHGCEPPRPAPPPSPIPTRSL